uniref:Acyl carrier protein n=1 Tax=Brassica oleracea var. oleracea TaxID=109376 RepID=A0A0D3CY65_BRAOL
MSARLDKEVVEEVGGAAISLTKWEGAACPLLVVYSSTTEEVRGSFLDKSDVTDRVIFVVKNFERVDTSKVTPKAHFINDLGLDSLDNVEVVMALEEEFGFEIPDNDADKIQSVDLAVDFIASHPQAT